MNLRRAPSICLVVVSLQAAFLLSAQQAPPGQSSSSSSSSAKHVRKPASPLDSSLDLGSVSNALYRNKTLGFDCMIPVGWVLRTDEMNVREEDEQGHGQAEGAQNGADTGAVAKSEPKHAGQDTSHSAVLLAAFSRPPEATGEDVNSSIVIAAESAAAYPGLKDAAQYFGPLTEVATAQGFKVVNEPYQFLVGTKTLVRGDFEKDRGSKVMRQTTLVMLAHGYAVSFTFIGGSEDEAEELVQGLSFGAGGKAVK